MTSVVPATLDRLHDRVFVAAYARVQRASEAAGMRDLRRDLVGRATGRVLEIGAGTGLNLEHYPSGVDEVVVVEPSAEMRAVLVRTAASAGDARIRVLDGTAESIPAPDASFDAVVGTFVLCSVRDPAAVLREMTRLLRPGGRYLGLEHVRAARRTTAAAQVAVAPAWRWAVRGCRCDQTVLPVFDASPLSVASAVAFRGPRQPWPVRPGLRIEARRPEDAQ